MTTEPKAPAAWRWTSPLGPLWELTDEADPTKDDRIVQTFALHSDYVAEMARAEKAEAKVADLTARAEKAEAAFTQTRCPIGLDNHRHLCSAGTCHGCRTDHMIWFRDKCEQLEAQVADLTAKLDEARDTPTEGGER